ncbi:MAG: hypothetical protein RDU20_02995 [Desulfomonilaceae bacterium]|nr:hypothetical protein [Desulfomonilaceae bacterium]
MPWWAFAYVIVLAGVGVIGVIDDLRQEEPPWYIALGVASALFTLIFVVAWWHAPLAEALGKHVLPMLLAAVAFYTISAKEDLRKLKSDPEYAAQRHAWIPVSAVILVVIIQIPAYYCAVGLSVRAWFGVPN